MGKRRRSVPQCATCGKPVVQTKYGWQHRSGKASDNGHVPQPTSAL